MATCRLRDADQPKNLRRNAPDHRPDLQRLGPQVSRGRLRQPAARLQGRSGRPQRDRQVDPVQADPGRASRRRRRDQPAQDRPYRLGRSGASGDPRQRHRHYPRGRRRTPYPAGPARDRRAGRDGRDLVAPDRDRRRRRARARRRNPGRSGLRSGEPGPADVRVLGRLADARRPGRRPVRRARHAAAGRTDQLPRPGRRPVAGGAAEEIPAHRPDHLPRPRDAERGLHAHPAPREPHPDPLHRQLRRLRKGPRRKGAATAVGQGQAGRRTRPPSGLRRSLQGQGVQGRPGPVAHEAA